MAQVAILRSRGAVAGYIGAQPANEESSRTFSFAYEQNEWKGSRWRLGLFLSPPSPDHDPVLLALCLVHKGRAVTTFERAVKVERIRRLEPPISLTSVRTTLGQHDDILHRNGALTGAAGDRLLVALATAVPTVKPILDDLTSSLDAQAQVTTDSELLGWEKDATGTLLRIADMKRDVLRSWQPTVARVSFLDGLPNRRVHEDTLITHDADRFPDWLPIPVRDVGWRMFVRPSTGDELLVYNANNEEVEDTLGVDLLYYHEQYRSFVLVQYKKLERATAQDDWGYRPDARLRDQIRRMREIDEDASLSGDDRDYRLFYKPCWVKLCKPRPIVNDSDELIEGMYLPREVIERLIDDPSTKGPRGGTRLTYGNVPRYFTNSTFTSLVGDGWVGSSGVGTDLIQRLIREALADDNSTVVGIHTTQRPPGNSPRRQY
jgi:hypothetical protein